jgi:hypothetical protein
MKITWGWRIAILYGGFVVFMATLVIASTHQHFDLVSKDYYGEEIAYQKVIDAGKNQAALSMPLAIHANGLSVTIEFPDEFASKILSGNIMFYSPVDAQWDRNFKINVQNNSISISRDKLHNTRYTMKINWTADGKSYYQESQIILH